MLVVKIEVWPEGYADRAYEISRIGILNLNQAEEVSNYSVVALTERDEREKIALAHAKQHYRATGWVPLVSKAIVSLKEPVVDVPHAEAMVRLLRSGHRV